MKILFVVEHFYPYTGGAEELFLNLTVSLARKGYDVQVVTTLFDTSLKSTEVYRGVHIKRIRCYNRFLFTIFSVPEIFRQAKDTLCIHTTSYNSAIPAFIAGFLRRKKVVITFHEVWGKLWFQLPFTPKWKLLCYFLFEWFILKIPFYRYIAVSGYTQNSLVHAGIPGKKIIKIYNGLDYDMLAPFKQHSPGVFTFCYFGRLGISKGIDMLLGACPLFFKQHPEAILKLIIPTYPAKLFLKIMRLIKASGIEKNILLMHNLSRENLLKEVSTSSCVIIPSYSEGFCFVAAECAGMDVPAIISGKGSLPEVAGGRILTPTSFSPQAFAESLEKAFNNEWDYRPQQQFLLEKSVEEYLNVYEEIKKNL